MTKINQFVQATSHIKFSRFMSVTQSSSSCKELSNRNNISLNMKSTWDLSKRESKSNDKQSLSKQNMCAFSKRRKDLHNRNRDSHSNSSRIKLISRSRASKSQRNQMDFSNGSRNFVSAGIIINRINSNSEIRTKSLPRSQLSLMPKVVVKQVYQKK